MNIITILLIVNVFAAIGIIGLVLMQQSKGDMGSAFGGGGSQSMFGSRGSANFLSRATSTLVTVFFISSLALAYTYAKRNQADEQVTPISVEESDVPQIGGNAPVVEDSSVPTIEAPAADDSVPSVDDSSVPAVDDSPVPAINEAAEAIDEAMESEVPPTK